MRDQDKDRSPERAQKRALADGRTAWRKMSADQRTQFLQWIVRGCEGEPLIDLNVETWEEVK